RQVVDAVHNLLVASLERKAKADRPGALRDVDESASPHDAATQPADVDVALAINLAGAHERGVQSSAVVEVKLRGMRNDRGRMGRDAKVDATRRHAAVDAGFDSECY